MSSLFLLLLLRRWKQAVTLSEMALASNCAMPTVETRYSAVADNAVSAPPPTKGGGGGSGDCEADPALATPVSTLCCWAVPGGGASGGSVGADSPEVEVRGGEILAPRSFLGSKDSLSLKSSTKLVAVELWATNDRSPGGEEKTRAFVTEDVMESDGLTRAEA